MIRSLAALIALLTVFSISAAKAQGESGHPLSFARTITGYDAQAAQRATAEHFAGEWRVAIEEGGEIVSGVATVASDGSDITLILNEADGEARYRSVEIDAMKFPPDTGPFAASLGVRFKKQNPADDAGDEERASAAPLFAEARNSSIVFELSDQSLNLGVQWLDEKKSRLQMRVMSRGDMDKLDGRWAEEKEGDLTGGGIATWLRGEPVIAGILVADDQLDASAGYNYPFQRDGARKEHVKDTRTLVVYGENLPKFADGAEIVSGADAIEYVPDFRDGADRERAIQAAYDKAGVKNAGHLDAFLMTAVLEPGVTPGTKPVSINGANGEWPLVFANGIAVMRFVRGEDMATSAFFPGDIGYVSLAFEAYIPLEEITISISRGERNKVEDGVLLARPYEGGESAVLTYYRTEPIHFYHRLDETKSPPEDDNALRVPVLEGAKVSAALVDPAEALAIPPVAEATIFDSPDQLGSLWNETLDRVAACHGDDIEDYEAYQHEPSENVSRLILAELGRRSIELSNGDHAAALLIRDEFVKMTSSILPDFDARARNAANAVAYRERAKISSAVRNEPFWELLDATYVKDGWFRDTEITMPLRDTLDEEAVAERLGVSMAEAKAWAEEQTADAAQRQVTLMQAAISTAQDAGDCDIGALLLVASHRSPPTIGRILPRLVKQEVSEGPPRRQYWVPDGPARGFVKALYITGDAVRAIDAYAEADTNVALAVAALATFGGAAVLEGLGYAGAALWTSLAATAIDVGFGAIGVEKYLSGEEFYDFARGASQTMGDGVLDYALSQRQSAAMTAIGALLPVAGVRGTASRLRSFKNVRRGREVFRSGEDVLDRLSDLSDSDRIGLAGYYSDLLAKAQRSGIATLDDADRAAFDAFQEYFAGAGIAPPSATAIGDDIARAAARGADEVDPYAVTRREPAPSDPRIEETIAEPPPVNDPRLDPTGRSLLDVIENAPVDDSLPLPPPRMPAPDLAATPPGSLSDHLSVGQIQELFVPGAHLTPEQIIQKADLIRSGRVPPAMAQGDPRVLAALDEAFGITRERPLATPGGTIIEPGPNASALDDTAEVPPPSVLDETVYYPPPNDPRLAETVLEPPASGTADPNASALDETAYVPPPSVLDETVDFPPPNDPRLAETVLDPPALSTADSSTTLPPSSTADPDATVRLSSVADPNATPPPLSDTVPPNAVVEGPFTPESRFGETIDGALARSRDAALRDLANYQPGAADRLTMLDWAQQAYEQASPGDLAGAAQLQRAMTELGVPEEKALAFGALHYRRPPGDFSPQMNQAHIVAEAIVLNGQRKITAAELAAATGVSRTAARAVIENTFARLGDAPGRLDPN